MKSEGGPAGLRELDRHWTLRVKEDAERAGERIEKGRKKREKGGEERRRWQHQCNQDLISFLFLSVFSVPLSIS